MPIMTEEVTEQVEQVVTQATEAVSSVQPILNWENKAEIMVFMAVIVGLWLFSKVTAWALKLCAGIFLLAGSFIIIFN
jgi:hypothetical protein